MEVLTRLFEEHFNLTGAQAVLLPISGSDRRYFRLLSGNITAIGTYNSHVAENNTFFYFTELFRKHDIHVPEVYRIHKDRQHYLQQDLGSFSLFDQVMQEGHTEAVKNNYRKSIAQLARLQWVAGREADFKQCFATQHFDEKAILADLQYFTFYYANLQHVPYDKAALAVEMEEMSRELGRMQPQTLMYRDFQTRNILLHEGKTYFIDYQGCMQGPPHYDVASLLWQAKTQLPDVWKEQLLTAYIDTLNSLPVPRVEEIYFRKAYIQLVLLRLLQALGAYGFRGLMERKPHFLSSIHPALQSLHHFLEHNPKTPAFPELRLLLEKIAAPEMQEKYVVKKSAVNASLTVHVCSFSYKQQGMPQSEGTHGGGFVFDCRGIVNPGRYAACKYLTGKDEAVRAFLTTQTKMPEWMAHVCSLAALSVDDYLARGFDSLSIAFGCTGGQHRSVYAAEELAAYLKNTYGVTVILAHLNEANWVL
jgi:aminoglycoside/choline kinase family phosphotransferase